MDLSIARLLAALFDIPDWAPRACRRAAILILCGSALLAPTYFDAAVNLWEGRYEQTVMDRLRPLLDTFTMPTPPIDEPETGQPGKPKLHTHKQGNPATKH